jgi:hypothetical protein
VFFFYAARSQARLEEVCVSLQARFEIPPFFIDVHDVWRYAHSQGNGVKLNITKASNYHTIETWMPDCPGGVNYQVILSTENEPEDFISHLSTILGCKAVLYAKTAGSEGLT